MMDVVDSTLNLAPRALNSFGECWVCGGIDGLEMHHIIPRCYGGDWGPQVQLCEICHGGVHSLSYKIAVYVETCLETQAILKDVEATLENWRDPRTGHPRDAQAKALFLASKISKARELARGDANKKTKVNITLTGEETVRLRAVSRALDMPQAGVIKYAMNELHARVIGDTRSTKLDSQQGSWSKTQEGGTR